MHSQPISTRDMLESLAFASSWLLENARDGDPEPPVQTARSRVRPSCESLRLATAACWGSHQRRERATAGGGRQQRFAGTPLLHNAAMGIREIR